MIELLTTFIRLFYVIVGALVMCVTIVELYNFRKIKSKITAGSIIAIILLLEVVAMWQ